MKHSPQWYDALARSHGHRGFTTLAEIEEAEASSANETAKEEEAERRMEMGGHYCG